MSLIPPLKLQNGGDKSAIDPVKIVEQWLSAFEKILKDGKLSELDQVLTPDCWWRDMLGVSWDQRTIQGVPKIIQYLEENPEVGLSSLKHATKGLAGPKLVERGPLVWIESIYDFETAAGRGRGVIRLANTAVGEWKAWCISTWLHELKGFEEREGLRRPLGIGNDVEKKHFLTEAEKDAKDPTVFIIGAGQSGLAVAARLQAMGVSYVVIDKLKRVGDAWRSRYSVLRGHTPIWADNLPYLPMPSTWPFFVPKDKYADWLEFYAQILELDVRTETAMTSVDYDPESRKWTIETEKNGTKRTWNPRHVVLATGMHSAVPEMPTFKGQENFKGSLYHGGEHKSAGDIPDVKNKKVAVIGTSTSGHDISSDFYMHGADTTIIQRGATTITSVKSALGAMHAPYLPESGLTTEEADIMQCSTPIPVTLMMVSNLAKLLMMQDKGLHDSLSKTEFAVDKGDGEMNFLERGFKKKIGGFYIDVGTTKLIAEEKIKVRRCAEGIQEIVEDGLVLADGRKVEADIIVVCSGFKQINDSVRTIMGDKVADKVQPVWGLDDEGELRRIWRKSGHPGFWIIGGTFSWARFRSRDIAVQIQAVEAGFNKTHYDE